MKKIKSRGYWNKENCLKEARKYSTRTEWRKSSVVSYHVAVKNGWDMELSHIKKRISYKTEWTKEMCKEIAIKYKRRSDWQKGHPASYQYAYKNGWLNHCCEHMKK